MVRVSLCGHPTINTLGRRPQIARSSARKKLRTRYWQRVADHSATQGRGPLFPGGEKSSQGGRERGRRGSKLGKKRNSLSDQTEPNQGRHLYTCRLVGRGKGQSTRRTTTPVIFRGKKGKSGEVTMTLQSCARSLCLRLSAAVLSHRPSHHEQSAPGPALAV